VRCVTARFVSAATRPVAANLSSVPARKSYEKCADQQVAPRTEVDVHDRTLNTKVRVIEVPIR